MVLLIVFTILVLYLTLKDNFQKIMYEMLHMNGFFLFLSFLLVLGSLLFKAHSLYLVTKKIKPNYTKKNAIHLTLVTQFFNAITPFSTGGQPFQIYTLKKDGISITNGTNIIMQNFIVYQIALVLLGIITIIYNSVFHILEKAYVLKNLVVIGFSVNVLVILALFVIAFGKKINTIVVQKVLKILEKIKIVKDKEKTEKNWNTYIQNFHNGSKTLFLDKKLSIQTIALNFVSLLCLYAVPFTILYGMNMQNIHILGSIVASSYTMLIGAFVPIPGGTGGLEYGYLQFFGSFITGPMLNASMLLWRGLTYYGPMIIGAIALNIKGK